MKILIINSFYFPLPAVKGGAVETLIESYLDENEIKYHDNIDVVSIPIPKNKINLAKKYEYTKFIYIKNKSKNSIYNLYCRLCKKIGFYIGDYYINKVIKYIQNNNKKYDVIISENVPQYTMLLKKNFDCKIVLHLHNDFLNIKTPYYEKIISSCDYILTVSNYIKKQVQADNKCIVNYNGIDFSLFNKTLNQVEINNIRLQYNIKENDFIYIFVGRVVPDKGIDKLVDAFLLLNQKYENIKLFVIGSPSFGGKLVNKFYNNLLKKNNGNIIFTGYIDNSNLYKYYNISNVQVTPSIFEEPFGLTAIEALAMNKRIIVTNSGALPEIISKDYGIIVDRNNLVDNLYKAMEKEYLDRKSNENCINSLQQFSKSSYAKRLKENIDFICRRK